MWLFLDWSDDHQLAGKHLDQQEILVILLT